MKALSRSVRLEEEDTGAPRMLSGLLLVPVEELLVLPVLPPSRLSSMEDPDDPEEPVSPPSRLSRSEEVDPEEDDEVYPEGFPAGRGVLFPPPGNCSTRTAMTIRRSRISSTNPALPGDPSTIISAAKMPFWGPLPMFLTRSTRNWRKRSARR